MRKYFNFLFIVISILASCKNVDNTKTINTLKESENFKGINVGNLDFDFNLPNDWYRIDTAYQGVQFCLLTTNDEIFQPKINVTNESMQGLTHDKYVASTMQYLFDNSSNVKIIDKGQFQFRDKHCIWVSYNIEQNGLKRELIFYSIENNGISYNITSAVNSGGRKKYKNTFEHIVRTFRLN